jgi:HSP20 family molecular chaperone IbpA
VEIGGGHGQLAAEGHISASVDNIVRGARGFDQKMKKMGIETAHWSGHWRDSEGHEGFDAFPPINVYSVVYSADDGSIVFEFALPGFCEDDVTIIFQGDYLVLSAKASGRVDESTGLPRPGFSPRDIVRQRYSVPIEEYAQELASVVFRNGILTVTVPPREPKGESMRIIREES